MVAAPSGASTSAYAPPWVRHHNNTLAVVRPSAQSGAVQWPRGEPASLRAMRTVSARIWRQAGQATVTAATSSPAAKAPAAQLAAAAAVAPKAGEPNRAQPRTAAAARPSTPPVTATVAAPAMG